MRAFWVQNPHHWSLSKQSIIGRCRLFFCKIHNLRKFCKLLEHITHNTMDYHDTLEMLIDKQDWFHSIRDAAHYLYRAGTSQ